MRHPILKTGGSCNSQANNENKKLEMTSLTNEQWNVLLVDMISKQKPNELEKMTGKSI